jgi:hypothetical protein
MDDNEFDKKKFDVLDNCEISMEIDPRFYRKI